jgi:high affinity sulfate transporter 1
LIYDVFAGVAVTAMVIPQSIALALLAGLDPIYGLYSVWITCLIYACMGNSKQLSFGPETVASLLVGITIHDTNPADPAELAHVLSFLTGIFLFALGIVRFGFLDSILSRPLMCGFINAIGAIIIMEQLDGLLGISNPEEHEWHKLIQVYNHIGESNWQSGVLGLGVVLILFTFKFINMAISASGTNKWYFTWFRFVPGVLVAVVISTLLTYTLRLDKEGVKVLGPISSSFPTPYPPQITSVGVIISAGQPALIIGVLGFIESIIVAKYYANKHGYGVSPNRELVAMGMANIIGSFFRTFPAFGSMTRSAVADMAGAKSQLYNIIVAFGVLGTILFLGPLFYYLPKPALCGILIVAAFNIFELTDVHLLWTMRAYKALMLLTLTFVSTIVLGIELGLLVGLGISVFIIVKNSAFPHIALLGRIPNTETYRDIAFHSEALTIPGIIIMRIDEALYFANIGQIKEMLSRIERLGSHLSHPTDNAKSGLAPLSAVIIDAQNIYGIDPSAVLVMREMVHEYRDRSIQVYFVKLHHTLKQEFILADIIDPLGGSTIFSSISMAVAAATAQHGSYSSYDVEHHEIDGRGTIKNVISHGLEHGRRLNRVQAEQGV